MENYETEGREKDEEIFKINTITYRIFHIKTSCAIKEDKEEEKEEEEKEDDKPE